MNYSVSMRLCVFVLLVLVPSVQALEFNQAYIRAMPPSVPNTAIFGTLENKSKKPIQLIRAELRDTAKVEFHTHVMNNGVMQMRPMEQGLMLQPNEKVTLKPGGKHLMVFGVKQQWQPGTVLPLVLIAADGQSYEYNVKVASQQQKLQKHESHQQHKHQGAH